MAESSKLIAVIETDRGTININLFQDRTPNTVANFANLSRRGFFNGLAFHRIIADFMIQGGCPLGNGTGGPGYQFDDEFDAELRHHKPGILSMANSGINTNGSQFFITHVPCPWLDGKHTVFGEVVGEDDQAIVNSIVQNDTIKSISIEGDITELMNNTQENLKQWNSIIDSKFSELPDA